MLCWCDDLRLNENNDSKKERNFLCGLLDKSGQVCQVTEYKLGFYSDQLDERCVERTSEMTNS